ncbi:hypothetical protein [Gemmatimonas sp.]|uniref:hypothetical protein n=1 Tax=Gemmatimonas sp. TaxID=1962908 RepID=UPI003564FFBE
MPANAPDETLTTGSEDKQRLSARTIADLRVSVDSLSAQLAEFYENREQLVATVDADRSAERHAPELVNAGVDSSFA